MRLWDEAHTIATPRRTISTEAITGRVKVRFSQKASTKQVQGMMHSLEICTMSFVKIAVYHFSSRMHSATDILLCTFPLQASGGPLRSETRLVVAHWVQHEGQIQGYYRDIGYQCEGYQICRAFQIQAKRSGL